MMQMGKEAAITIRVPLALKRRLEARARREHRSVSAQAAYEIERAIATEPAPGKAKGFLGRYERARIPADEDMAHVRSLLWGRMGRSSRSP